MAALLVGVAALLDLLDGLAARLLNTPSAIGKELDSLADLVSFGVVPAMTVHLLFLLGLEAHPGSIVPQQAILAYVPFLIAIFSGLRLARFNVDPRQTDSFIGLPVPANALFWMSFPLILSPEGAFFTPLTSMMITEAAWSWFSHPWFLLGGALVSSLLLTSEIPLFSLKFKDLSWKENAVRYIFLLLAVLLIILWQVKAVPIIVVLYLLISIIHPIIQPPS